MFYALLKDNKIIGIFDNLEGITNMILGLNSNGFCKKNKLSIKKFKKNSIVEVKSKEKLENSNDVKENLTNIKKLSCEEEIKKNKEKCEIEFQLNKLKKEKEKINESKKIYEVDLELYKKFKKIKSDNSKFIIPDLFTEKYKVFEMIDSEDKLNWENFYANYKPSNLSSLYSNMFTSDDAKTNTNVSM